MACFAVPAAEAIVVTIAKQTAKAKEKDTPTLKSNTGADTSESTKIPFSRKLSWLTNLLWGGSFLLAFEHVWHGEVTPWFPFLTAAGNAADAAEMLHEMATSGVMMAVLVTLVWVGMVLVANTLEKRAVTAEPAADAAK